jgi:hypothetical protein
MAGSIKMVRISFVRLNSNTVNPVVKEKMRRWGDGEMGSEKIKDNLPAGRQEGKRLSRYKDR